MYFIKVIFCAFFSCVFYTSSHGAGVPRPPIIPSLDESARWKAISTSVNEFGFDFHRRISEIMKGYNVVFSPYSLFMAFSTVCVGARGNTRKEMMETLKWGKDKKFTKYINSWSKNMASSSAGGNAAELLSANKVWVSNKKDILSKYVNILQDRFDVDIEKINLANPTQTEKEINDWVGEQTRQNIKNLFPSGSINAMTRLIIVNAIYFKGKWAETFKKEKSRKGVFCLMNSNANCLRKYPGTGNSAEGPNEVPVTYMMKQGKFPFSYGKHDKDADVLELPYNGPFSMFFLKPVDAKNGIKTVEEKMSSEYLNELIDRLQKTQIVLQIPKFKMEQEYNLEGTLMKMGDLFDANRADLSGINGRRNDLYVSDAIHKAKLTVDEEGTEAAAVTGIQIQSRSRPPSFELNRPFLFYIMHRPTKTVIFSGKMMQPKDESDV